MTTPQPPARLSNLKSKIAFVVCVLLFLGMIAGFICFSRDLMFVFVVAAIAGFFAILKEFLGFFSTNFDPEGKERWDKLATLCGVIAAIAGVPTVVAGLIQIAEAAAKAATVAS